MTCLLPLAAWTLTSFSSPLFHPSVGAFFVAAACLSAAIGGLPMALAAIALNAAALNLFVRLYHPAGVSQGTAGLWTLLLVVVAFMIGYAREKWSAAESLAGRLRSDLARLRDELESQRSDLKRFHELSVRLSSSLELHRLLNDVLSSIATLQKTDLALMLVLPERGSKTLRVQAFTGFAPEQIKQFDEFPASFFSPEQRVLIEDIKKETQFPFTGVAESIGFKALFSMPISNVRNEPLGVVVTFFRKPHSPSERQSRLVELYARQAANALDNAKLYRNSLDTLAAEQARAAVLRALAEASVQINSALTLDSLMQVITDQARSIIGARQAFTTLLARGGWHQSLTSISTADGQPSSIFPPQTSEMFALACNLNKPMRLSPRGKNGGPWRPMMKPEEAQRGWLAAPLLTRDGRNLGLIQLADKMTGEFSSDDEAILVQLTHMASVAIENVRLYREAQEQIAETRRAQEALERSKESMELAQKYVGIGIWEWDLQTGALVWSDELRRLHGFAPESFDGRYESWMESIHSEDRQQVHQAITDAMARSGEYEVQYRVVFPDRSLHWLEARGRTILISETPVRMLGVAMDVTARKASDEALRHSEKLAATGHLAASIAHEINNPLAAVTNALYILRTHTQTPRNLLDFIRTAEMELSRVVHITRQTLGFYRQISTPVTVDVHSLLDETMGAFESRMEKHKIVLHRRYSAIEALSGYPAELRQVFSNLLLNALEAAPEGGNVSLRTRQVHDREGRLGVRVTIADDGAGIAPENMPHIFEPFFSTKATKGTGLGLWVSQGLVQKHGGTIRLRSSTAANHHGTCFAVFLPFPQAEQPFTVGDLAANTETPPLRREAAASGNDLSAA
ncbi:MAG TPA: ATP-binding protein [Candidatus Limnocylindrales bacterium]|nr:ATP-binding protein [Candidatus Limnocylindrales bacterium]